MAKKVLIVDDEENNRELFRQILQTRKIETIEVENGKVALSVLESEHPDLILLDLFMADGDGLSVIQFVRGHADLHAIPIVVITAAANEEIHQRIQEAGCDLVMRKPIDMHELLKVVARFLE